MQDEESESQPASPGTGSAPPPMPTSSRSSATGVVLEEIAYFMDDMDRDLWWLLRAAHTIKGLIRGDEQLPPVESNAEAIIERLAARSTAHLEGHATQTRSKIVIIPSVTPEEAAVLQPLADLDFHCRGRIIVIHVENAETNHRGLWGTFHGMMAKRNPEFMLAVTPPEGGYGKSYFAQCVAIVPVYVTRNKDGDDRLHLFAVYCSEKKKRHWAFVGGDTKPGFADRTIMDAAKRVWADNIGIFIKKSWDETFKGDPVTYVNLEKDGVKYPIRPYMFIEVTDEFFEATKRPGGMKLPPIDKCIRVGDEDGELHQCIHTEGYAYQAFEDCDWLDMNWDHGRITSPDERNIRKENADILRVQPDLLWRNMFAKLLNKTEEDLIELLGKNLPREPPYAVRVSQIDKTATDDDLKDFFENSGPHCDVVKVEQMDQPKHSARVEFADVTSLRAALRRDNDGLKRRKVKVELWLGFMGPIEEEPAKPKLRTYDGPLPTTEPFRVKITNLDRSVNEDDLGYFFWDRACEPKNVKMGKPLPKHTAEVEFADQQSLRTALGLNGAIFKGRDICVDLWDDRDKRRVSRQDTGGLSREEGRWRDDTAPGSPSRAEGERPRLKLKPRSADPNNSWRGGNGFDVAPKTSIGRATGGKETRADMDDNWRR